MTDSTYILKFGRIGALTIGAVYTLILVGGIVRATGAGMGCPDWPTCFGQWIPPTHESQLPGDYQQIYADRGYAETKFNTVKTWTEYINRLLGASIGLLILLTLFFSAPFLKTDRIIFYLSLVVFSLVAFQGWLGGVIVASNLQPAMITLHMIMALVIVAILIYTIARSQKPVIEKLDVTGLHAKIEIALIIALVMTLAQVVMGTQVREAVDTIAVRYDYMHRDIWRFHFPLVFYFHRTFAALILILNSWIIWNLCRRTAHDSAFFRLGTILGIFVLISIATGITMDRFGIPAVVQPIHLVLATLIFGVQFFIFIMVRYAKRPS